MGDQPLGVAGMLLQVGVKTVTRSFSDVCHLLQSATPGDQRSRWPRHQMRKRHLQGVGEMEQLESCDPPVSGLYAHDSRPIQAYLRGQIALAQAGG
ncbi:hypothetical protein GCM10009802_14710 [Streptomyces synnematoformans]|uniref:Transposase n=1 Tax=Streptomyces synnematoformans TaxID=415721 RepID=A0ABN2XRH6_9ACTN